MVQSNSDAKLLCFKQKRRSDPKSDVQAGLLSKFAGRASGAVGCQRSANMMRVCRTVMSSFHIPLIAEPRNADCGKVSVHLAMKIWGRYMLARLTIGVAAAALFAGPVEAKMCFTKAAVGNSVTENLAKFQVDAALLQATNWSIYFTYISGNGTPGYTFGPRVYKCGQGAVGWQCRGSATLCKVE